MERPVDMGQDLVSPPFDRKVSFEAKYAIDSIACFLQLCRIYHQQTLDSSFVTDDCLGSTKAILQIIREQRDSTYTEYGSQIFMDDASPLSLLSLPYLGFCCANDPVYKNTRAMVLSRRRNLYFLDSKELHEQGSPHVNPEVMWPVGTVICILTSDDDEILAQLEILKKLAGGLGLIHEAMDVNDLKTFLRTWYAWGNSSLAEMILDLAVRKPGLILKDGTRGCTIVDPRM
ncbi:hypothetical protein MPDQ_001942 [Monascus purpureus]|uniref:Uncharacterized protein n=1 Tax=Monascus purpureus TaxID=5098 RepID=A0A507QQF4_MONPU|nr:hypothetical protein MPDQ_001942 [Monascus purpureus]